MKSRLPQIQRFKAEGALLLASLIWGCFPIYWSVLGFTSTLDILAHRIGWSFVIGLVVHRVVSGRIIPSISPFSKETLFVLAAATVLSMNWGISIYAVQIGRVVEGGIGMYFAPIFQVIIGIIIFGETVEREKIIAIFLLLLSAVILLIDLRSIPFIALGMGGTFAIYASLKKSISLTSLESFLIESGLMLGPALVYIYLNGTAFSDGGLNMALLIGAGLIAAPPLILYGFGVQRTSLSTSGMILTLIPLINIIVGAAVLGENLTLSKLLSIGIILLAVIIYTLGRKKYVRNL